MINETNINKYSRQLLFWPDGEISQRRLSDKKVTIIGVGALGSALANHLVRAGIGEIRLVDRDFVEESNLQRQMLFDEDDVYQQLPKAIAAFEKLRRINSEVNIVPIIDDVNATNIEKIVENSHLILDGTDNMLTRFLINDVSIKQNIPWIYGGVVHSRAMTTTIIPGITPCYRCLFSTPQVQHGQTCDTIGVLSTAVHIIASYQATEAFKILIEDFQALRTEMLQLDVWQNDYDLFPFQESLHDACPCCQNKQFEFLEARNSEHNVATLCGRDMIQITPNENVEIDLSLLKHKWSSLGEVKQTTFLLKLKYKDYELSLFKNGRLLVKGTTDLLKGKQLYSSLIGD